MTEPQRNLTVDDYLAIIEILKPIVTEAAERAAENAVSRLLREQEPKKRKPKEYQWSISRIERHPATKKYNQIDIVPPLHAPTAQLSNSVKKLHKRTKGKENGLYLAIRKETTNEPETIYRVTIQDGKARSEKLSVDTSAWYAGTENISDPIEAFVVALFRKNKDLLKIALHGSSMQPPTGGRPKRKKSNLTVRLHEAAQAQKQRTGSKKVKWSELLTEVKGEIFTKASRAGKARQINSAKNNVKAYTKNLIETGE